MQQKRAAALAQLQQARKLIDDADALIGAATQTLEEDGAYTEHGVGDVCGVVRDAIGELEGYVNDYVA